MIGKGNILNFTLVSFIENILPAFPINEPNSKYFFRYTLYFNAMYHYDFYLQNYLAYGVGCDIKGSSMEKVIRS